MPEKPQNILEGEYDRITQDVLGYALYSKAKVFIYNSVSDLQQSNIGINNKDFTSSGQTDFVKPQVEVAYPGNAVAFKQRVNFPGFKTTDQGHDVRWVALLKCFKAPICLIYLTGLLKGGALYITNGWSVDMDDYMRDYFKEQKVQKD